MLALMGLLAGQMMYQWKMDLIVVTLVVVAVTLARHGRRADGAA